MDDIDLNNLPDNPEDLHKAFEQIEAGEELVLNKQEEPAEQSTEAAEQGQKDDEGQAASEEQPPEEIKQEQVANEQSSPQAEDAAQAQEAAGVATKDGKHIIPYSVLKGERDRAARAEQMARAAEERLAALQAQLAASSQGANTGEGARTEQQAAIASSEVSEAEIESIKDDFPVIYKAIKASMAKQQALEGQLRPVEERVRMTQAEREREAAQTVQEAIDAVPKLAHMQATNHGAFELAKQIDATLRMQAAWADKPLSERFGKVVEMVESAIGPIDLPGQAQAPAQPVAQPKASLSTEDLTKAAKAKAVQATKATSTHVPTSLSDFPAGQPPAINEREAAEQLTAQQLYTKFAGMSADQMDEYLRSL